MNLIVKGLIGATSVIVGAVNIYRGARTLDEAGARALSAWESRKQAKTEAEQQLEEEDEEEAV